jgi:glycosyltransferase involved in cell wall biosynthesis
MKIAYITHSYKPYIGGVQYVVEQMAVEMAKRGHDVEVLTLTPPFNSLQRIEKLDGYVVRRFLGLSPSNSYYVPTLSFIKALIKLQADIVHVHVVHSLVPFAVWIAKKFKPRWRLLILTPHFHNLGFSWHTNIAWFFYRPILKKIIKAADVVHSISPHEAQLLKEKLNVNPMIIPHGISEDILSYKWKPPARFTAVYSGRLAKYKRVDLLIKAVSLLNKRSPEVHLLIVGDGPRKAKLVKMAKQLKVNSVFIPPLPRRNYLKCLAESSVLCYLSESEAFSVTTLEAIAIGLPVIIVEPWGNFFKQYSRVVVLPSNTSPEQVANALSSLKNKTFSIKDNVPTWSEVADKLMTIYKT